MGNAIPSLKANFLHRDLSGRRFPNSGAQPGRSSLA
jgi:hypothetical protein